MCLRRQVVDINQQHLHARRAQTRERLDDMPARHLHHVEARRPRDATVRERRRGHFVEEPLGECTRLEQWRILRNDHRAAPIHHRASETRAPPRHFLLRLSARRHADAYSLSPFLPFPPASLLLVPCPALKPLHYLVRDLLDSTVKLDTGETHARVIDSLRCEEIADGIVVRLLAAVFEQQSALRERMHGVTGDGLLQNLNRLARNAATLGVRQRDVVRAVPAPVELIGNRFPHLPRAQARRDDQSNALPFGGTSYASLQLQKQILGTRVTRPSEIYDRL